MSPPSLLRRTVVLLYNSISLGRRQGRISRALRAAEAEGQAAPLAGEPKLGQRPLPAAPPSLLVIYYFSFVHQSPSGPRGIYIFLTFVRGDGSSFSRLGARGIGSGGRRRREGRRQEDGKGERQGGKEEEGKEIRGEERRKEREGRGMKERKKEKKGRGNEERKKGGRESETRQSERKAN